VHEPQRLARMVQLHRAHGRHCSAGTQSSVDGRQRRSPCPAVC
jgi:hypothetical protein